MKSYTLTETGYNCNIYGNVTEFYTLNIFNDNGNSIKSVSFLIKDTFRQEIQKIRNLLTENKYIENYSNSIYGKVTRNDYKGIVFDTADTIAEDMKGLGFLE